MRRQRTNPWSADREKRLEIAKDVALYLFLGTFAGGATALFRTHDRLAVLLLSIAMVALLLGLWASSSIRAMEPNKPRGDVRQMTTWTHWPPHQETFGCWCGRLLSFTSNAIDQPAAVWTPNEGRGGSDPGGGRWCIVCDCGRGHYKFNDASRMAKGRNLTGGKTS